MAPVVNVPVAAPAVMAEVPPGSVRRPATTPRGLQARIIRDRIGVLGEARCVANFDCGVNDVTAIGRRVRRGSGRLRGALALPLGPGGAGPAPSWPAVG